jgi:NAD(P)-dependent dehydrogenase (short-subunit alcohol dehydrogenase family)
MTVTGKFYRHKNANHPHTNMAKAALNMMTRTSAQDYVKSGIYMTAVDTGWINDENPLEAAARTAEKNNFQTPIDEIDAASRVLDPVMSGVMETDPSKRPFGIFLKDYRETEW